jgi:hypothetical protein
MFHAATLDQDYARTAPSTSTRGRHVAPAPQRGNACGEVRDSLFNADSVLRAR